MTALGDMAGMNHMGEIRPEDGDPVEWGQNTHRGTFEFASEDQVADSSRPNHNKRRNQDLFVI